MGYGPGPVCGRCGRCMSPRKTGLAVVETYENGDSYKVWAGDMYECTECGAQVVVGFSERAMCPQDEHYAEHVAWVKQKGRWYVLARGRQSMPADWPGRFEDAVNERARQPLKPPDWVMDLAEREKEASS